MELFNIDNKVTTPTADKPVDASKWSKVLSLTGQTLNPSNIKPITPTDITKAPVVQPDVSGIQTQAASIGASIQELQKELDAMKAKEKETPKEPTEPTDEKPGMWDTLLGKVGETKEAITTSQQDLTQQISDAYSEWGLTPENFNKLKDLSVQIGDVNKQIAELDTREAQALEHATNIPGQDLAFMSGEKTRISRAYAIQRAGLAAKASAMASTASALQGNWDTAFGMAQTYVNNATIAQRQIVDDLKWGLENYSDIIQSMSNEEQKQINAQLDYQSDLLKAQQDDYWKQMNYDLKASGVELDWAR